MMTVELIYDRDCPNVAETRAHLLKAFAATKWTARWQEWDRSNSASPPYARAYGSPTVLVGARDIAGLEPSDAAAGCRLYADTSGGMRGVPPVAAIVSALQKARGSATSGNRPTKAGWLSSLATLPGIGATLLPVGLCPACWPAYAGVLSALGLGFLLRTTYLLPVTALFLLVALGALAFRAGLRRRYGPFILGLIASATVLIGKFIFVSDTAMYGGIVLLVAASIWNAWPGKSAKIRGACPACAPEGQVRHLQQTGAKEVSP